MGEVVSSYNTHDLQRGREGGTVRQSEGWREGEKEGGRDGGMEAGMNKRCSHNKIAIKGALAVHVMYYSC